MKKSHVINIVKKIIAIFIIVLILNNNYINYNVFAVDTGEQITDNNTKTDTGTDTGTNTETQGTKPTSLPTSLDDIISNGKSFLQLGVTKNEINEDKLKTLSSFVSSVLLWIAIAVTLISAIVMGINFLTQSVEDKAKIKESMTPWVIGIIISFSAYTIWQITINIFSNL